MSAEIGRTHCKQSLNESCDWLYILIIISTSNLLLLLLNGLESLLITLHFYISFTCSEI